MLELEQLLAQGRNKVVVGGIAVDFESVAVVAVTVGHCSVSVLVFKECCGSESAVGLFA